MTELQNEGIVFDEDPIARAHTLYPKYLRAVADGRATSAHTADFWCWLRDNEGGVESAAATSPHGNAADWDTIVADLNRDVAKAKASKASPENADASASNGGDGWDDIVANMNARSRR